MLVACETLTSHIDELSPMYVFAYLITRFMVLRFITRQSRTNLPRWLLKTKKKNRKYCKSHTKFPHVERTHSEQSNTFSICSLINWRRNDLSSLKSFQHARNKSDEIRVFFLLESGLSFFTLNCRHLSI